MEIPLRVIYEHPTIAELALCVTRCRLKQRKPLMQSEYSPRSNAYRSMRRKN